MKTKKLLTVLYIVPFINVIVSTVVLWAIGCGAKIEDIKFGGLVFCGILSLICLAILLVERLTELSMNDKENKKGFQIS